MNNPSSIITLFIEARGEVVSSNFWQFADMVRVRLGEINRDLASDEDFDQADADAKAIAGAEAALKAAKEKALADAEQLHALFESIDALSSELAAARLDLAGQIKKRKEEVKAEIVEEFLAAFDIEPKLARKHFLAGLQTQIKGKRTLESMRTACRVYQTTQQAMISKCRDILASFEKAHGQDLISDWRELELEKPEGLEAELRRRFEAKRAREEKARLEAEAAAAKAEVEVAKAALAEASKPPLGTSNVERPTSNVEKEETQLTADEEWKAFKAAAMAAFVPLKAAKAKLVYPKNIAKATIFSNAINKIWKDEMQ